jgi:arylsulfatase B
MTTFFFHTRCFFLLFLHLALILPAKAQQNIIIFIADDLGADYCGFMPNSSDTANMPTLRQWSNQGIRFTQAWASPYCSSTRAGILTGRYGFRTGVGTVISGASSNEVDSAEVSIAELLKYHSPTPYATGHFGKWHMNNSTPQKLLYPTTQFGYDIFQGNFSGAISDYYNWVKITNGVQTDTITTYATTETINDAINWLDTLPSNKPFFIWFAFNAPHTPFHLPPGNLHTVPGLPGTTAHINNNQPKYFKAAIEAMDSEISRLKQWLAQNGRLDSTNIIFIGDNGNDKRVSQHPDSTHNKGTLYDYGVHIPMFISGPAVVNPNRNSATLVNTQDLFSTVQDLANFTNWNSFIPTGTLVDSRSLLPVITNQQTQVRPWAFTELFTVPMASVADGKTIRNADYHLIRWDNGNQAFYHYPTDPLEANNLLTQANLTSDQISNYYTLCNELNTLCNIPACLVGVGLEETVTSNNFTCTLQHEQLFVQTKEEGRLDVFNALGQHVQQFSVAVGSQTYTMPLAPGVYFCRFESKQGRLRRIKIVQDDLR